MVNRDKCSTCGGYGDRIVAADDVSVSRALRLAPRPMRRVTCSACDGSGHGPQCASCNGYGTIDGLPEGTLTFGTWSYRGAPECPSCGGTGNARAVAA